MAQSGRDLRSSHRSFVYGGGGRILRPFRLQNHRAEQRTP
jgi:hypothetical protein